jgi:hypothetical protein
MWIGRAILDNCDIPSNFSKENLQEDIDNLYAMGGKHCVSRSKQSYQFHTRQQQLQWTIMDKTASVIEIAENVYNHV